ncbi:hypothetical protein LJB88_05210, partial [Erysipelotrichaceae bacterium OttesenSCG-928-M19]|nr:hypothetical protein [Erysipelotrichaceae bacterium OttesenSCG-928-M19]
MNEEIRNELKMNYIYIIVAIILSVVFPFVALATDIRIFGDLQLACFVMVFIYHRKITKQMAFENQKKIANLLYIWIALVIINTFVLIGELSQNIDYLYDDSINIVSESIGWLGIIIV